MSLQTKLQGLVNGKTAVVNSINAKAETSLTVNSKWSDLVSAVDNITTGGGGELDPVVLTGNCENACGNAFAVAYLKIAPEKVSTYNISNAKSMFQGSTLTEIPFDINFYPSGASSDGPSTQSMFHTCTNLTEVPKMLNLKPYNLSQLFYHCESLREIPEDLADTWNWFLRDPTNTFAHSMSSIIDSCYSLRKVPYSIIEHTNPVSYYYMTYLDDFAYNCYSLDEAVDLPLPFTATYTYNIFGNNAFKGTSRLKNFTFALDPQTNQPYVMNWSNQIIDLSYYCGWANDDSNILDHNSGITADKRVTDLASYEALKNDPDWWTTDALWSRYNYASAVATINSLPDTSAYLAENGGTNTIKFKAIAGGYTMNSVGSIENLQPDEIAVATAKGWTVVLV